MSWQAKYPNQLHQLDSTVAQQFYLNDDGTIGSFLHAAWSIKNDDVSGFPFYGLPKILYTDNDSVVKSKKFQRATGARLKDEE